MVGIVVVSHSEELARGVLQLARQMAGDQVALQAAGGTEESGVLGTDATRIAEAITRAMSPDGVLVLMDLGSALISSELALELVGETEGPVALCPAPLVEGAVAAAVAAAGGGRLEQVAAQARDALSMKIGQLQEDQPSAQSADAPPQAPEAQAEVRVVNQIGLHARPAARLVELARRFDARSWISKRGADGQPASATSLTGLLTLGARLGDTLLVQASGPQAAESVAALCQLISSGFGEGVVADTGTGPVASRPAGVRDELGASAELGAGEGLAAGEPARTAGPAGGELASGELLDGVAVSPGVAAGPAHWLGGIAQPPARPGKHDPDREGQRLRRMIELARASIAADRQRVAAQAGEQAAAIFDAHLALLDDEALVGPARAAVAAGAGAEQAFHDAAAELADRYRRLPVALLAQRAVDVLDVGERVVSALSQAQRQIQPGGIALASELTPAQAASLDAQRVLGVATAHGTATAHAAILARALGLPAVVGLGERLARVREGTPVLLDGDAGTLQVDPPSELLAQIPQRQARQAQRRREARRLAKEPGATRDGHPVAVLANIGSLPQAQRAVALGAEGVGLLRTEFLFAQRPALPSEEEQVAALEAIAQALDGRPLTVRTLDAGADKPIPALAMEAEPNPFLGVRGIRATLRHPEVLATQLRAILRVGARHPVTVMLPMVATAQELEAAGELLQRARSDVGLQQSVPLGIMVEVPAAALRAKELARRAEFFSIGTNDLTQYTMAADRTLESLGAFSAGPQPAVLALIQATVQGAASRGRPVAVCGELAGDPAAAILLVGLGVGELSVAPELVGEVKAALRAVDSDAARAAAQAALQAPDAIAARAQGAALL
jgi:phosphoenolpyruvate-protein phosphotransferase/dihydroxyacetone kinase phosphotransfer subunit